MIQLHTKVLLYKGNLLKSEFKEKSNRNIMVLKWIAYPPRDFPCLPPPISTTKGWVVHTGHKDLPRLSHNPASLSWDMAGPFLQGAQVMSLSPRAGSSPSKSHLSQSSSNSALLTQGIKNVVYLAKFGQCTDSQGYHPCKRKEGRASPAVTLGTFPCIRE